MFREILAQKTGRGFPTTLSYRIRSSLDIDYALVDIQISNFELRTTLGISKARLEPTGFCAKKERVGSFNWPIVSSCQLRTEDLEL